MQWNCFSLCSALNCHAFYFGLVSNNQNYCEGLSVYRCPETLRETDVVVYQDYGSIASKCSNMSKSRLSGSYNWYLSSIQAGSAIRRNTLYDNEGQRLFYLHRYSSDTANYTIIECNFVNNTQHSDSQLMYLGNSNVFTFLHCVVRENKYTALSYDSRGTFTNCSFCGNRFSSEINNCTTAVALPLDTLCTFQLFQLEPTSTHTHKVYLLWQYVYFVFRQLFLF
jgi:transcription elongation factor Elf1